MEDQLLSPESQPLDNFFNITFDETIRAQIKQAAVWAKICTLCTFAGYVVALVVTIFGAQSYSYDGEVVQASTIARAGAIATVLITTAIGAIINYFLYRFAVSTAKGVDSLNITKTNEGFNSLRIYFKIYGIILIIVLSIAGLVVLIGLIGLGLARR
jgi:hypothetical protein